MKKAKAMLLSLAVVGLVSGAFAFTAKNFTNPTMYTAKTTGVKGTAVTSLTTASAGSISSETFYTTTISTAVVNPVLVTLYFNGQ